jgi:hypothetical protein
MHVKGTFTRRIFMEFFIRTLERERSAVNLFHIVSSMSAKRSTTI